MNCEFSLLYGNTRGTIGSFHEISIAFRHTWLESVFHVDSHSIFFFKLTEMCVFLI